MYHINSIKLQNSCILNAPFEIYEKDFSFIVNGEEFKTSKIVSDLISRNISKIHSSDPTFDRFTINTKERGDFSNILKLIDFNENEYPTSELPFLFEIIEILDIDCIEPEKIKQNEKITIDNVFDEIEHHSKYSKIYGALFSKEIEFISSHFSEIYESKEEELIKLSISSLYSIFTNDQLQMKNEDELLKFINKLYITDSTYSILYETVLFENVSTETIKEFINIYDIEMMTHNTWVGLSIRLCKEIKNFENDEKDENDDKYRKRYNDQKENKNEYENEQNKISNIISFSKDNEYDGIINYLRKKTNDQIEQEINITASTIYSNDESYHPRNVTLFNDHRKYFGSSEEPNSWMCFDFKEHRIIPTAYSLRSFPYGPNNSHPKSWVVECSNDNKSWETVDEQKDCSYLNGKNYSHTFTMNHQKSTEYQFIRMRLTGPNCSGHNFFRLNSFEIYGQFI